MSETERTSDVTPRDYLTLALAQAPRLLSALDRMPASATRGSFDRRHWAWKFRDFPIGMSQSGLGPLSQLWQLDHPTNVYHHNERLLEWIEAGLTATCGRQHGDGSFDGFAPNERDPGPTLGIAYAIGRTLRALGDGVEPTVADRSRTALTRACDFAMHRSENHAFVSNHWALFALAFLDAAEFLGETRYSGRATELMDRILDEQSPDGWYREYNGPDPGYESLGIGYLARYYKETGDARVLESLSRSVSFFAHCVHPDGSVGGPYGHRHTSLYYPGGFESLSEALTDARAVADFMRSRLRLGNVVTLTSTDAENLPSLMSSYITAFTEAPAPSRTDVPDLPFARLDGVRLFEDSGIVAAGSAKYYAVFHGKRGGVGRVHEKPAGRLVYEDAGYLGRSGRTTIASQYDGMQGEVALEGSEMRLATAFARVRQVVPTPFSYLTLRVLNLTLFRVRPLGNLIRRLTVRLLITRRKPAPVSLERTVEFGPEAITIRDRLTRRGSIALTDLRLTRDFVGIHMGSARYFHSAELETTFLPDQDLAADLTRDRQAESTFVIPI